MGLWRLFLSIIYGLLRGFYVVSPKKGKGDRAKKGDEVEETMTPTNESVPGITLLPGLNSRRSSVTSERSPLEDPRVSWIYELNKEQILNEMKRYRLNTEGSMAELRKTFIEYWKNPFGEVPKTTLPREGATKVLEIPTSVLTPDRVAGAQETSIGDQTHLEGGFLQMVKNERDSIREMLGLSPNADSLEIRRVLSTLVGPSQLRQRHASPPRVYSINQDVRSAKVEGQNEPVTSKKRTYDSPEICNVVRKWNIKFDGRQDPVSFLERLDELLEAYSIFPDDILKALPEMLRGNALLWHRNNKDLWRNFQEFRRNFELQFLPPGYGRSLHEEIRKRTQGEHETFRMFVIALTTLIRRGGTFTEQDKLDVIYSNMKPEYKMMVRRQDCQSLSQMVERAEEYEAYVRERMAFRAPPPPSVSLVPEVAYYPQRRTSRRMDIAGVDDMSLSPNDIKPHPPSKQNEGTSQARKPLAPQLKKEPDEYATRRTEINNTLNQRKVTDSRNHIKSDQSKTTEKRIICWNCEEEGHTFNRCNKSKWLHCFYCKAEGVPTTRCLCRQGNLKRAQEQGGRLSSTNSSIKRPPMTGNNG